MTIVGVAPPGFHGHDTWDTSGSSCRCTMRRTSHALARRRRVRGAHWLNLVSARLQPGVGVAQAKAAIAPSSQALVRDIEMPGAAIRFRAARAALLARADRADAGGRGHTGSRARDAGASSSLLFGMVGLVLLIACAQRGEPADGPRHRRAEGGGDPPGRGRQPGRARSGSCFVESRRCSPAGRRRRADRGRHLTGRPAAARCCPAKTRCARVQRWTRAVLLVHASWSASSPALALRPRARRCSSARAPASPARSRTGDGATRGTGGRAARLAGRQQVALRHGAPRAAGLLSPACQPGARRPRRRSGPACRSSASRRLNGYTPARRWRSSRSSTDALRQRAGRRVGERCHRRDARRLAAAGQHDGQRVQRRPDADTDASYSDRPALLLHARLPLRRGPRLHRRRTAATPPGGHRQRGVRPELPTRRTRDRRPHRHHAGKPPDIEIVGVVADAAYRDAREAPPPQFFRPYRQTPAPALSFYVRTAPGVDPAASWRRCRRIVHRFDAEPAGRRSCGRWTNSSTRTRRSERIVDDDAVELSPGWRRCWPRSASMPCWPIRSRSGSARSASAWRWAPARRDVR